MASRNDIRFVLPILIAISLTIAAPAMAIDAAPLPMTLELAEIDGELIPFQSGVPLIDFEPQDRPTLDLAGTWKKERVRMDVDLTLGLRDDFGMARIALEAGGRERPDYDDSSWQTHAVPGVEEVMPGHDGAPPDAYHRGVWYRRTFDVPADWDGRVNRLVSLGANYVIDVFVNGDWVGYHEGGYTPFAFDVSENLLPGAENTIAVRAHKPLLGLRPDTIPSWIALDWWEYGGLVQDVYLASAPALHVVRTDVVPRGYNGRLEVRVVVFNASAAEQTATVHLSAFEADTESDAYLTDPRPSEIIGAPAAMEGRASESFAIAAGATVAKRFFVKIPSPNRWTPREPYLYVMKTALVDNGVEIDAHHTQFGVRSVARGDAQVLVNGRASFFPGVARHEEWPDTGRTATFGRIRDDLLILKELNALFLREGHYPNHVYTNLLTDRLGFAVFTEIPVYWFFGWNWQAQEVRMLHRQMFREMVFANYNRPSILFWGTENENVFLWANALRDYNQMLADDLHTNYDDGRLISQSPAADIWKPMAKSQEPLDVAGWTLYYGVFYGEDAYTETLGFFDEHESLYPDYPIIGTEYGYWGNDGEGYQRQTEVFTETWRAFEERGALFADGSVNPDGILAAATWWCAFDWFTKNGLPEIIGGFHQSMGLVRMDRETWKPAADELAAAYAPYYEMGGLGPVPPDTDDDDWPDPPGGDDDDDSRGDDDDDDGCGE